MTIKRAVLQLFNTPGSELIRVFVLYSIDMFKLSCNTFSVAKTDVYFDRSSKEQKKYVGGVIFNWVGSLLLS